MILQIFDPRQKDETRFKILFQIFYNIAITAATLYIFKTKGKFCIDRTTIGKMHPTLFVTFVYLYYFQKYIGKILKKYKECFGDLA